MRHGLICSFPFGLIVRWFLYDALDCLLANLKHVLHSTVAGASGGCWRRLCLAQRGAHEVVRAHGAYAHRPLRPCGDFVGELRQQQIIVPTPVNRSMTAGWGMWFSGYVFGRILGLESKIKTA